MVDFSALDNSEVNSLMTIKRAIEDSNRLGLSRIVNFSHSEK